MRDEPLPSPEAIYDQLRRKLGDTVAEAELSHKARLVHEIQRVKRDRNAVVLGQNYMEPALFHSIPTSSATRSRRISRTSTALPGSPTASSV